jgi:hypothetical protein
MKLAEALLGWDLLGFHPKTAWRRDGLDATNGNLTYDPLKNRRNPPVTGTPETLFERKGPYLELATTPVFHVGVSGPGKNDGLYVLPSPTVLYYYNYVICDVFGVRKLTADNTSKTVTAGTPILYYRANTSSKDITNAIFENRIYNFKDNQDLIRIGKLTSSGAQSVNHPLLYGSAGPSPRFYEYRFKYILTDPPPPGYGGSGIGYGIKDPKISTPWPYNPDSYILISAGMDGLYGTEDDIHNY